VTYYLQEPVNMNIMSYTSNIIGAITFNVHNAGTSDRYFTIVNPLLTLGSLVVFSGGNILLVDINNLSVALKGGYTNNHTSTGPIKYQVSGLKPPEPDGAGLGEAVVNKVWVNITPTLTTASPSPASSGSGGFSPSPVTPSPSPAPSGSGGFSPSSVTPSPSPAPASSGGFSPSSVTPSPSPAPSGSGGFSPSPVTPSPSPAPASSGGFTPSPVTPSPSPAPASSGGFSPSSVTPSPSPIVSPAPSGSGGFGPIPSTAPKEPIPYCKSPTLPNVNNIHVHYSNTNASL
jgi:hypothetical protein